MRPTLARTQASFVRRSVTLAVTVATAPWFDAPCAMTPRRFALAAILVGGCVSHAPWGAASEGSPAAATRRVDIEVTAHGFQPNLVRARPRETITLVFERTIERSCADHVIISLDQKGQVPKFV